MPDPARLDASMLPELERIVHRFTEEFDDEASRRVHRRLLGRLGAASTDTEQKTAALVTVGLIGFAADVIAEIAPSLVDQPDKLQQLVDDFETHAHVPRLPLARDVLRTPRFVRLAPQLAIEVELALVLAFTRGSAAAAWAHTTAGGLTLVGQAGGPGGLPPESREIADAVIAGQPVAALYEDRLAAIPVHRWGSRPAALLVVAQDALAPDRALIIEAATPLLTLALERLAPRSPGGAGDSAEPSRGSYEQDVVTAAERRLARLRFDLHDGPQQDVLLLAEDLRLFRDQLTSELGRVAAGKIRDRIDDLEARLVALDGDMRRISVAVQSPFLHRQSFAEALDAIVQAFTARTGVEPEVELNGNFSALTDSQHITLLGLVREALSNIREHSDAAKVTISVSERHGAVAATVVDDGRGFDPEATLVEAARRGHLGLVGMHERVRLLGGSTRIDSQPGGPTVVSVTLPPAPAHAPQHDG